MSRPTIELTGQTFGRLKVIAKRRVDGRVKWKCRCSCGKSKVVFGHNLRKGDTQSCGCIFKEVAGAKGGTKGVFKPPSAYEYPKEHGIWKSMHNRCYNTKQKAYPDYGGRGITVCKRWHDFENFIEDMGPRPSSDYELDRKDNDKGYKPSNVRWTTRLENVRNRRSTLRYKMAGQTKTLKEWAEEYKVNYHTLYSRLKRVGSIRKALNYGQ